MKNIKESIKSVIAKVLHRDRGVTVEALRKIGVSIGSDVHFYDKAHIFVDKNFPWMLTIGNHVHITSGVHILCHDYSWIVGKNYYHEVTGGIGKVTIGNNVFIGTEAIVLMNSEIGDNVIIGAQSVVCGKIPNNCVAVGSPAKPIMSLDEYWQRRKAKQYEEAVQLVLEYKKRYDVYPPKEKLPAYFYLFEPRSRESIENNSVFKSRLELGGNYKECLDNFMCSEPLFDSYESFLKSISE